MKNGEKKGAAAKVSGEGAARSAGARLEVNLTHVLRWMVHQDRDAAWLLERFAPEDRDAVAELLVVEGGKVVRVLDRAEPLDAR